jgi:hypothetical protein
MNKRGRPKKNGMKPLWMLRRITLVLRGYQKAREAGVKHSVAIQEAVRHVRETEPQMPISETEVRRTLARYRSSRLPYGYFVVEPDPTNNTITLPGGRVIKIGLTVCLVPRVDYPRINASQHPSQQ